MLMLKVHYGDNVIEELPGIHTDFVATLVKSEIIRNGLKITNDTKPVYEFWAAPSQILGFEIVEYEDKEEGIPVHLHKRTPAEQMVYYMTKYTLLQAEKRELTDKLTIAVKALEFISRQRGTTSSGCASKALDKIHAIGKESDDG